MRRVSGVPPLAFLFQLAVIFLGLFSAPIFSVLAVAFTIGTPPFAVVVVIFAGLMIFNCLRLQQAVMQGVAPGFQELLPLLPMLVLALCSMMLMGIVTVWLVTQPDYLTVVVFALVMLAALPVLLLAWVTLRVLWQRRNTDANLQ